MRKEQLAVLKGRACIIGQLEQMLEKIKCYNVIRPKQLDDFIFMSATEIMNQTGSNASKEAKEGLSENECNLITELCMSFKMEYMMLTASSKVDYPMMGVMLSAILQIISDGIDEQQYLSFVTISYDTNDNFVGYKLSYKESPSRVIIWAQCTEEGVEFEKSKLDSSLAYLSDEAKENLAAINNLELKYEEKDDPDISYATLVANYFNIFETEILRYKEFTAICDRLYDEEGRLCNREQILKAGGLEQVTSKILSEPVFRVTRIENQEENERSITELIEELSLEEIFYVEYSEGKNSKDLLETLYDKLQRMENISKEEYDIFKAYLQLQGVAEYFSTVANRMDLYLRHLEIRMNYEHFSDDEIDELDELYADFVENSFTKDYEYRVNELHEMLGL